MDSYNEELYDCARTVTPQEAVNELLSAVILRAVLDYRDAVRDSITVNDGDYSIENSYSIIDLERFFHDVNFKLYPRVRHGVLEFRKLVDSFDKKKLTKDDSILAFKCPICGGSVMGKIAKVRVKDRNRKYNWYNKFHCDGCLFSIMDIYATNSNEEIKEGA